MRLKVSVRRYSLPTTNIIFTTRALGPAPATSSTDATIAQLLEDVNDIVPLESANWGLEDYAVEVNGYECLHFSPIDAVLRDDDEVVIRALKTQDLRSRRLGGRHQISSDGRHLIDGVAFGRPRWRQRPAAQGRQRANTHRLPELQFLATAGRQARALHARRGADALPRVRPRPASLADARGGPRRLGHQRR